MTTNASPLRISQVNPAYWRVTLENPPINLFDPDVIAALRQLVDQLEGDDDVKVVVFDSADPEFFISHVDLTRVGEDNDVPTRTGLPPWPDVATRLEQAPFITVGSVRGRARGVGSEFLCALDIRFASREKAVLCQPEVAFGFFPGGGGMERLPLLTGRSRAMEIIIGAEDFDADTAERYGWINRSIPDAELDAFVERFANRVCGFDKPAIVAAKRILNERGQIAHGDDQVATYKQFVELLRGPEPQARAARFLAAGGQQRTDMELNLADGIARV